MRSFGSCHVANTLEERKVASFIFQCVSGKVCFSSTSKLSKSHTAQIKIPKNKEIEKELRRKKQSHN